LFNRKKEMYLKYKSFVTFQKSFTVTFDELNYKKKCTELE